MPSSSLLQHARDQLACFQPAASENDNDLICATDGALCKEPLEQSRRGGRSRLDIETGTRQAVMRYRD